MGWEPQVPIRGLRTFDFETPGSPERRFRRSTLFTIFILFAVLIGGAFLVISSVRLKPPSSPQAELPAWKIKPKIAPSLRGLAGKGNVNSSEPQINEPPPPQEPNEQCLNTVQGRQLITDNTGAVCYRNAVLPGGCCDPTRAIAVLSCTHCRIDIGCCTEFEYCVSCCLKSYDQPKSRKFSAEQFDQCMHICRISSRSIKHGNEYKRELKYCFTEEPMFDSLNFTGSVVLPASVSGLSCDSVCEELQMWCIEEYFPKINTCRELQAHFNCQVCIKSGGLDQPGYMEPNAPGLFNPGTCLVNTDTYDCSGFRPFTRRLCICLPRT